MTTEITAAAAAAALGRKGGRAKTAAKAASSRRNGLKGGDARRHYYLLSGEGDAGTWEGPIYTTPRGIKCRATRERCNGGRWCRVWELVHETDTVRAHLRDIETGDTREVPEVA